MKRLLPLRILGFLMAASLILAGCAKEYSEEFRDEITYYVRFKIDGVQKEYLQNVLAVYRNDSNLYSVLVQGVKDLSNSPESMTIVLSEPDSIRSKVYTELSGSSSPALLYRDSASSSDFSNVYMTSPSGVQVSIAAIDSTSIRGTFQGMVSDVNGNVRDITEGAFRARFQ